MSSRGAPRRGNLNPKGGRLLRYARNAIGDGTIERLCTRPANRPCALPRASADAVMGVNSNSCLLRQGNAMTVKWFRVLHRRYGTKGLWTYGWFFPSNCLVHANETVDRTC
jgi:hypothetical protein